jgi:hypothetical protein
MSVTILEDGLIQDSFELTHDVYGVYRDALVMLPDEYNTLAEEQIAAMKQQRLDNWAANLTYMIENPPVEEEVA